MAINMETAVSMFKQRKDMLTGITQRDEYIDMRIKAVISELESKGIHLVNTESDLMLVVDMAVWQYNNRDNMAAQPMWLTLARRERWLNDRKINEDYAAKQAMKLINQIMERLQSMNQSSLENVLSYVNSMVVDDDNESEDVPEVNADDS